MQEPAKGLSQHYGYWVIFITTPIIFLLASWLFGKFTKLISNIEQYCTEMDDDTRRRLETLVHRHTKSLKFKSLTVCIFVFLLIGLLYWWLFNVIKTISPSETYHHDVFDAYAHSWGFYTAKLYTLLVFSVVYSIAIFIALHVTVSMISILRFLSKHNILRINLFHADNCGGTSPFGNINLIILGIYSNFFAIDFAMFITHRETYLAVVASLAAAFALAITQSIAAVYSIHTSLAKKKSESLEAMAERLNRQFDSSLGKGTRLPSDLLTFRNHLADVYTYPYATGALTAVNVIRFAPAALAVITYVAKR